MKGLPVCFLGGARYDRPLDKASETKFRLLAGLGKLFIIGYSKGLLPRFFTEHARFYLLPQFPIPVLRYAELFAIGPLLILWLIWRHGVRIIVAQSPYEGLAGALAKKIARRLGVKVVLIIESHGDFEESLFFQRRILLPRLYRFLMRYAAALAFRNADLLRAVSHSTRRRLERWTHEKLILQFPAWTNMEVFLEAGASKKEPFTQNILYAGVLIPGKGIHHLINAFARIAGNFPEASLAIVGREENEAYATKLKEQTRGLSLDGRVQFVGEVPQKDLAGWMHRANVFVLPSISEGLGRVVLEAMASGTPVIGSNVGGIPEMVENGATGFLVPPSDEVALAEKIQWVFERPDAACELAGHARALAQRFFSTEAYLQGYRQLFKTAQMLLNRQAFHHAPSPF